MYQGCFETRVFDDRLPVLVCYDVDAGYVVMGEILRSDFRPLAQRTNNRINRDGKLLSRLHAEMREHAADVAAAQKLGVRV